MVNISVIPASTATSQNLLVELTEPICERVCVNSTSSIGGSVSFSYGTPVVINEVAVVPITATGSIVILWPGCPCKNKTIPFVEKFDVPFVATTDNAITLTPGSGNVVNFTDISCCKSSKVKMKTTLQVAIA